jgi:nicotinamidase-related amidase
MRRLFGHEILETLPEIIRPTHTALLIIDLQNDFLSEGGYCERNGHPAADVEPLLTANLRLIDEARGRGIRRIYTRYVERKDGSLNAPARLARRLEFARDHADLQFCLEATWGYDLVSQIRPTNEDVIIDKTRGSAFIRTDLEERLRESRIQTLIVTGVAGGGCVEATVRDALQRDFYVVLPADCVSDCQSARYRDTVRAFERLLVRECYTSSDRLYAIWADQSREERSEQLGAPKRAAANDLNEVR